MCTKCVVVNISVIATSVFSLKGYEEAEAREHIGYRFMKESYMLYTSPFDAVVSLNLKDITNLNNIYFCTGLWIVDLFLFSIFDLWHNGLWKYTWGPHR